MTPKQQSSKRPLVGVTGPNGRAGWVAWMATRIAVWRAGGRACRITPASSRCIEGLDALVIGGGADIDPCLYNEEPWPQQIRKARRRSLGRSLLHFLVFVFVWFLRRLFSSPFAAREDKPRDRLERELIRECLARELPILGICRGMQLLNVHFGGSLFQDISSFYVEAPMLRTVLPRKKIEILAGSKLAHIIDRSLTHVNSLHHQSVKALGQNLRVSAQEANGVIQAIEHTLLPYVIGVQWHPEFLPQDTEQQDLFRELVSCARAARGLHVAPIRRERPPLQSHP